MQHEDRILTRKVEATLIPHGDLHSLEKGDKVTITHRLGGNYTVMTLNGMYRIAAQDADALGEETHDDSSEEEEQSSEPADEDGIRDALRTVFDPEIPVNIVDLGLIYKIEIEETEEQKRHVSVDMTLTAPGCPVADEMPGWIGDAIKPVKDVKSVHVEMIWEPQWGMDMMSDEARLELGFM